MNDVTLMAQLDSGSVSKICQLFDCSIADIVDVQKLAGGNTNASFAFSVFGARYVYRHPGPMTATFIDRSAEQFACERASELGVGEEILFMDAATGVKVSRFIEQERAFDFLRTEDVEAGAMLLRRLHEACIDAPFVFDHLEQIKMMKACMDETALEQLHKLPELDTVETMVQKLDVHVKADGWPRCLNHGDPKGPNILVAANRYTLIDWEYAGVKDIGYDISHYAAEIGRARTGGLWELERADAAWYFGASPSDAQYRHVLACFAIEEYYWTLWAIQQKRPDIVNRCYSNAAGFAKRALNLYTPNKI